MAILQVEDIQKRFGRTRVLEDISFSLEQGQAMAIIGSSGSGKTTLLRCLNFLEQPDRGRITVGGEVLFDADDPATQRESEVRKKRLHFGRGTTPTSSPAASSSGWPSPGPWPSAPISSALTSPPPPWTRSSPARCCG